MNNPAITSKMEKMYDIRIVPNHSPSFMMNLKPMTHNQVVTLMGKMSPRPAYRFEAVQLASCVMWDKLGKWKGKK